MYTSSTVGYFFGRFFGSPLESPDARRVPRAESGRPRGHVVCVCHVSATSSWGKGNGRATTEFQITGYSISKRAV